MANYRIDLSGQLRARGHNAAGLPWRVAVLMVMPPAAALRLANGAQIPALLISRDGAGYDLAPSASWRAA